MTTERTESIEVVVPADLLEDIDEYAETHGYSSRSAVVAEALS